MRRILLIAAAFLMGVHGAAAQSFPTRLMRVIVPAGAGSAVDIIPRLVFEQLSAQLGQPIVVENRPGAGGTIGTAFVAKSEPDGYTILANSSAHTISPSVYSNLPYDTVRDFSSVALLGSLPNVLIISPAKGLKTIAEFVAAAKAKPGSFNYASTGVGTATHISAVRFLLSAGIDAVHVPFKGGPEALSEVIAGRVDFYFCPLGTALPLIRSGKLLALAVSTPQRAAALPDVPTTLEAGFANSDYTFWVGMFVPAKTPRETVDKLHDETLKAVQSQNIRDKFSQLGIEPILMSPADVDARVKDEIQTIAPVIKAAGIN